MLLWFSLQYSDLERTALSLGYEPEYIFSDVLDRDLMEWTGRVPQKYPGDYIPDEIGLEEWVYHWFKDISEGRKPMRVLDHDDIEFREAIEKRNQTKDWRKVN